MDNRFERKGNILYYKGEQIKLRLQCSFQGATYSMTWKFPYKRTDFNKNLKETYLTLLEQVNDILKLNIGDSIFSRLYRDEKDSKMIVTRIL